MGDGSQCQGSAINNVEGVRVMEAVQGEVVTAGEVFINKCISSCSTIN